MTLSKSLQTGTPTQRALVFQGGGALGAYEAGVFREIYKSVKGKQESRESNNSSNTNLFDIVAGTSIGAINATVLVGYFLKNDKNWEGSSENLTDFWKGLMTTTLADRFIEKNSYVGQWWDWLRSIDPNIADTEAARRFWSIFQFAFTISGVPNMYFSVPQWNYKFLNPFTDLLPWWRYDYEPLRNYLSKFVDFPIKTSFENGEPRLLLISLDVQDYTTAVVFDSYKKQHDAPVVGQNAVRSEWYSEYGQQQNKHVVFYDGIGIDQVLASTLGKYALDNPSMEDSVSNTKRQFWDGGYYSNTPLRQLILDHRKYWYEYLKRKDKRGQQSLTSLPDLEVYIVNLHPSVLKKIPRDKDSIDDREHDIIFHDRTNFDEHLAYLISDYVDLAVELIEVARLKGLARDVDLILNMPARGFSRSRGESKHYKDIIEGRFDITKVWRIDRAEDSEDIFGKTTDFSATSIRRLIEEGEKDAKVSLNYSEILFTVQDMTEEGVLTQQEGRELMEKTKEVTTWSRPGHGDQDRAINNLQKFIVLVNDADRKKRLSLPHKKSLIGSATDIINHLRELKKARADSES